MDQPEGVARVRSGAGRGGLRRAALGGAVGLGALFAMGGCEVDAWMGDPSIVGRWENTPTVVPILERIDIIESDTGEFVDVTEVTPSDLLPEPLDYRISAGDFVHIEIWDIVQPGFPTAYDAAVTQRGYIDIPQLGQVEVGGLTATEVRQRLEDLVRELGLVGDSPVISVTIPGQRQAVFSVFGAIQAPARYGIPYPDYRLLEALTDAGGVSPIIKSVFVIRQIPLSDAMTRGSGPLQPRRPQDGGTIALPPLPRGQERPDVEDINSLIEELTAPEEEGGQDGGSPGAFGALSGTEGQSPATTRRRRAEPVSPARLQSDGEAPIIDLPESERAPATREGPATGPEGQRRLATGQWVFLDGRWVQVMPAESTTTGGLGEGPDPLEEREQTAEDLVTQRVIRVPVAPLLKGVAKYNIVIRPGDVIHVPAPESGIVYALGPGIGRPGTYNLPSNGRLTIQRLVAAAGGLSAIAIPERVDLTRVVGENTQATIRLNVRAIFEGTQPDIRLRPDDMVNFGTNFWATPMAVIRNGFRMSYGFGFLLDRNFGNDVFGAPPTRLQGR